MAQSGSILPAISLLSESGWGNLFRIKKLHFNTLSVIGITTYSGFQILEQNSSPCSSVKKV